MNTVVSSALRFRNSASLSLCLAAAAAALMTAGTLQAQTPLVVHGDSWRYHKGTNAPAGNWKTVADSSLGAAWLTGKGGIGFADNTTETGSCQTLLTDMKGKYTTVAMRKSFQVSTAPDADSHLILTVDWDDGFIAWLDGNYLTSENTPGAPAEPAFDAVATSLHESSQGDSSRQPARRYDLGLVAGRLAPGTHVLSVLGLNQAVGSSDFIQVVDLALQTNAVGCVSGTLAGNSVWRVTDSPILVCGSVTIPAGGTLVIEPGVTVQFDSGAGLTVADGGTLLAEGTTNAPILFTHAPGAGNWDHVTIEGTPGSPETRIAHAHFEFNAASTGTPCIEVAAGTAYLDSLTFGNTGAPYIHVDGASFTIRDCVFPTATASFELVHGTGGVKAGGRGLFLRNFFGAPTGYNDVVDFTGGNRPAPIVHFINNVFMGGQDDGLDIDGTDAWVEQNIFLHIHRNGATPDSSAAVSGGSDGSRTSRITVIGNLFFDCDNAATAKQGNFYTFLNNTIVHITKVGGIDGDSGAVNVRDTTPSPTTFALGAYLEGNVIADVSQLIRNYDGAQTTVTLVGNLLPVAWSGPGTGNTIGDPKFKRVPQIAETQFSNWQEAQVLWDWLSLQPGSPALGSGPGGLDQGAVNPRGAVISGEPAGATGSNSATLTVGPNRSGSGIPVAGWPSGSGYTHYRWRLDGGDWSTETSVKTPISLTGLSDGSHQVEMVGKLDTGLYQDDPLFGDQAVVSRSHAWRVVTTVRFDGIDLVGSDSVSLRFTALPNTGYTIHYRDSLTSGDWQPLLHVDPIPSAHAVEFKDSLLPDRSARFYRLSLP